MALSIRRLLDPDPDQEQQADTTRARASLGRLVDTDGFPAASADSIFGALGYPVKPLQVSPMRAGWGGYFELGNRQVVLSEPFINLQAELSILRALEAGTGAKGAIASFSGGPVSEVIAHEMAHEASLDEAGSFSARDPQIAGLLNAFFTRYETVPMSKRAEMFAEYKQESVSDIADRFRDDENDRSEIFAEAVERGYKIARQFDPNDPSKIKSQAQEADAAFPGTREATNFWIRSFLGMP